MEYVSAIGVCLEVLSYVLGGIFMLATAALLFEPDVGKNCGRGKRPNRPKTTPE